MSDDFHKLAKDSGNKLRSFFLAYASAATGVFFLALVGKEAMHFTLLEKMTLVAALGLYVLTVVICLIELHVDARRFFNIATQLEKPIAEQRWEKNKRYKKIRFILLFSSYITSAIATALVIFFLVLRITSPSNDFYDKPTDGNSTSVIGSHQSANDLSDKAKELGPPWLKVVEERKDLANVMATIASAIAATASLVVAGLSLWVAASTLIHQRKHNVLSVRPLPEITLRDWETKLLVTLRNNGTGPLIVRKLVITNGETSKDALIDWMPSTPPSLYWTTFLPETLTIEVSPQTGPSFSSNWMATIRMRNFQNSEIKHDSLCRPLP